MFLDWSLHGLNDLLYVGPPGGSRNPKGSPVETHTNTNTTLRVFTVNWIYSVYRISLKDKYMTMSIFQIFRGKISANYACNLHSILWQLTTDFLQLWVPGPSQPHCLWQQDSNLRSPLHSQKTSKLSTPSFPVHNLFG